MPSRLSLLNIYFFNPNKKYVPGNKCLRKSLYYFACNPFKLFFLLKCIPLLPDSVASKQRPNSWTYLRQKSLDFSSLQFTVTCSNGFYSLPPPLSKSGLKLAYNVNIVYGNLKSENFKDYAPKPQRNCT